MTKPSDYIPDHCHHKGKNLGFVRLNGRPRYTGKWGTERGRAEYDRLIAEWLANGRSLPEDDGDRSSFLVRDLVADYLVAFEESHLNSRQPQTLGYAVRPLLRLYGGLPVEKFRPKHLKAVRQHMIEKRLGLNTINQRTTMLRCMFRWGVEEERVPPDSGGAVAAVRNLRRGESRAKAPKRRRPVDRADVEAALPLVSRQIAAMIEIQWLTGMRSGEITQMKPSMIDRTKNPWEYQPEQHKTKHLGDERHVPIGPQAQAVLAPFLLRPPTAFVFSPREADEELREKKRAARRSKTTPSQVARRQRAKMQPKSRVSECYDSHSYARAIARACTKAGIERWTPHQLRHSAATRIKKKHGMEASRTVLGHKSADVTQIYVQRDLELAAKVMEDMG